MGKNNRTRRAAKAANRHKQQGQHRQQHGGQRPRSGGERRRPGDWHDEPPPPSERDLVTALWHTVSHRAMRDQPFDPELRRLATHTAAAVDHDAERLLADLVHSAWAMGWQPAEVVRQGKRATAGRVAARLVESAVAADHLDIADERLDPRWEAQLDALDLPIVLRRTGWSAAALAERSSRAEQVTALADAVACLARLPRLDALIPPPFGGRSTVWPPDGGHAAPAGTQTDPMIERVRNLLAKAESTQYEAEAMAFTAKAHELMTRHAIDRAVLAAGRAHERDGQPAAIRVFVDSPYSDAKALMLQIVASETRCRSVAHTGLGLSTVVGFPEDLEAVRLLFTSLLVQAQSALNSAGRSAPPGTRTRSQAFRSAFYLAFSNRIGERLADANRATTDAAAAEFGDSFLPVLANRARDVDEVFDSRFGSLTSGRIRGGWDRAGWASGTVAADQAKLHFGDLAHSDSE